MARTGDKDIIRDALVRSFKDFTVPQIRASGFEPSPMVGDVGGLNDGYYEAVFIRLNDAEMQQLSFVASGDSRCISADLNIFMIDEGSIALEDLKEASSIPLQGPPFLQTREMLQDFLPIPFLWIARNRAIAGNVEANALKRNADEHARYWASLVENIDKDIDKWYERHVMMTVGIADLRRDAKRLLAEGSR